MSQFEAMRLFVKAVDEEVNANSSNDNNNDNDKKVMIKWWEIGMNYKNNDDDNIDNNNSNNRNNSNESDDIERDVWKEFDKSCNDNDNNNNYNIENNNKEAASTVMRKPKPRYEHSMLLYYENNNKSNEKSDTNRGKVVIFSGNCYGRYLNDMNIFDLNTNQWEKVQLTTIHSSNKNNKVHDQYILPTAGQSACLYGEFIIIIGGHFSDSLPTTKTTSTSHSKNHNNCSNGDNNGGDTTTTNNNNDSNDSNDDDDDDDNSILVRVIDMKMKTIRTLETIGYDNSVNTIPRNRAGHSCCLIKNKVYMFGGEVYHSRQLLHDLYILDLPTLKWSQNLIDNNYNNNNNNNNKVTNNKSNSNNRSKEQVFPCARTSHTAISLDDEWILIFGGGASFSQVLNDCWKFNTQTMQWKKLTLVHNDINKNNNNNKKTSNKVNKKNEYPKLLPRAGHTSALIGTEWFIVGGGTITIIIIINIIIIIIFH